MASASARLISLPCSRSRVVRGCDHCDSGCKEAAKTAQTTTKADPPYIRNLRVRERGPFQAELTEQDDAAGQW